MHIDPPVDFAKVIVDQNWRELNIFHEMKEIVALPTTILNMLHFQKKRAARDIRPSHRQRHPLLPHPLSWQPLSLPRSAHRPCSNKRKIKRQLQQIDWLEIALMRPIVYNNRRTGRKEYLMALSIKNEQADKIARQLAALTGESITEAVMNALTERLQRHQKKQLPLSEELMIIGRRCSQLPVLDNRTPEQILGYDEHGLPT